ncbi:hypothetical protein AYO21_00414 [Fonsecaea monophora]|uniref:Chromo domain-containing protein n=1 Tax=Fonsecaea monophora TaxID=254056 RepID=A0A177FN00_9EURO|nr:hypothetical protein AYO21_00414 [Fonsecaea monophora]OAG45066.1 hypothetical protein AYO21_00414 [Fonsecaea monophora]
MSDASDGVTTTVEEPEYLVERILYQDDRTGKPLYLVKWEGYGDEECTWEPAEHFTDQRTLDDWERQRAAQDFLDEEELAMVQARMKDFQDATARKKRQEALRRMSKRTLSRRSSSRTPKSESPESPSSAKRSRSSHPNPADQPGRKRPRASRSPTVKEEAPQGSEVVDATPAQRPHPQNSTEKDAASAQPTSSQKKAAIPLATTGDLRSPNSPPSPLALAHGDTVPHRSSDAHRTEAYVQMSPAAPNKIKTIVNPTLGPQHNKQGGANTMTVRKKQGNTHATPLAANAEHGKAGKRFKSMRHMHNYTKMARRERTPDVSKLELIEADAWPLPGRIEPSLKIQDDAPRHKRDNSPLFLPEDNNVVLPQAEDQQTRKGNPTGPNQYLPSGQSPQAMAASLSSPTAPSTPQHPHVNQGSSRQSRKDILTETQPSSVRTKSRGLTPPGPSTNAFAERRPSPSRPRTNCATSSQAVRSDTPVKAPTSISMSTVQRQSQDVSYNHGPPKEPMTSNLGRMPSSGTDHGTMSELKISLRFGGRVVGIVSLVGMPGWLINKLHKLRGVARDWQEHLLTMEFKNKFVMEAKGFSDFSTRLQWKQHGTFSIRGDGAKQRDIEQLGKHLKDNDLVAVWEYPTPGDTLILIMYSSPPPRWAGIDEGPVGKSAFSLNVVVRNKLAGFSMETGSARTEYVPHLNAERDTNLPIDKPKSSQPALRLATRENAGVDTQTPAEQVVTTTTPMTTPAKEHTGLVDSYIQSPVKAPTPAPTPAPKSATPSRREGESPTQDTSVHPEENALIKPAPGRLSFQADFAQLFGDVNVKKSGRKARVMICFGESNPVEAEAVKQWLQQHLNPRRIFIDTAKDDWEDFRDGLSDEIAAILFHERHRAYCDLFEFFKVLRCQYVFCHELLFSSPLPGLQLENPEAKQRSPLRRLFPRGTALCITEDALICHPEEVTWIMRWFEEQSGNRPLSWRLGLPPDISGWLLRRRNESPGLEPKYDGIIGSVNRLNLRSSHASWNSQIPNPDEFTHSQPWDRSSELIQSPSALPAHGTWNDAEFDKESLKARDKLLLEWFVAWAAGNSHNHRHFIYLDSTPRNNKTENRSWHIDFRDIKSFVMEERRRLHEEEEKKKKKKREEERLRESEKRQASVSL